MKKMKPTKTEYACGSTKYNQSVVLTISNTDKGEEIKITKNAANQRDDTESIFGLSADNILSMAAAINEYRKSIRYTP